MEKLYETTKTIKGKLVAIQSRMDDWLTVEEARKLFKKGKGITAESLMNMVYAHNKPQSKVRKLPAHSFIYSAGQWWFHKPTLLGLKRVTELSNNAA